jgi:hexosaminidase
MTDRLAALLPYPKSVRPQPGSFEVSADTSIAAGPGAQLAAVAVRRVLAALPWPAGTSPVSGQAAGDITVDIDKRLADEGYQLRISPALLRITAGGEAGAFYAAQTMRQLLPDEAWRAAPVPGLPWQLPCAEIDDAPALSWRGGHLDVARHFLPKPVLLGFIDMLAAHKLNRFHLHLTDDQGWRIESRRYPALHEIGSHRPRTRISHSADDPAVYEEIPHGGYYTLADLAEISAYAAARMVTVVPEIEVPGHASARFRSSVPCRARGTRCPPTGAYSRRSCRRCRGLSASSGRSSVSCSAQSRLRSCTSAGTSACSTPGGRTRRSRPTGGNSA